MLLPFLLIQSTIIIRNRGRRNGNFHLWDLFIYLGYIWVVLGPVELVQILIFSQSSIS